MPLIRDWTDSLTVDVLDAHAERFFCRLLMKVDDYGRTLVDNRLLKSRLFPLKADIRETDISRWLAACHKAGLLRFYVDAKGRTILEVFKFGQRKRFMKSEFDPPEGQVFLPLADSKKICAPSKEAEAEGKMNTNAKPSPAKNFAEKINRGAEVKPQQREFWQMLKDEEIISKRLQSEREKGKPCPELIETFRKQLKVVRDEIRTLNKPQEAKP